MIRRALESDAAAVAAIYDQNVASTRPASCDIEPLGSERFRALIAEASERHPMFVYQASSANVVGYSQIKQWSVCSSVHDIGEIAVYVDKRAQPGLVGAKLMLHTLDDARRLGYSRLIAIILGHNQASRRALEGLDFQSAVRINQAARIGDAWIDILWYEKVLGTPSQREQRYASRFFECNDNNPYIRKGSE